MKPQGSVLIAESIDWLLLFFVVTPEMYRVHQYQNSHRMIHEG